MGDTDTATASDTETDATPLAETKKISEIFQDPTPEQEAFLAVFGLKESHIRAYIAVVEHPDSRVNHIAEVLDRHRQYVGKSLLALYDAGLVDREQQVFDAGGVGYVYSPLSPTEAKSHFRNELQQWMSVAHTEINKIDRRIESETDSLCFTHGEGN